jgi:hypothetical protein
MVKDPLSEGGWRRGAEKEANPGVHVGVSDNFESTEVE